MTGFYLVVALIVYALLSAATLYYKSSGLKLAMTTYTFLLASLVYFSLETYKGWPTRAKATEGQVVAIQIIEPSPTDPGAIYFWVFGQADPTWWEKIYTYTSDLNEPPRAYYLPYNKKVAERFAEARDALEEGMVVNIENMGASGEAGSGEEAGEEKKKGEPVKKGGNSDGVEYDVPHLEIESPIDRLKKG
jgi:hypothetical protein